MNGQLPPIDSDLREGLARRSAGRLPDGLLADISAALDGVREPRARARWPRLIWSVPRLAVAGMGVALVAILAVAIAFPAFHTGPAASLAGYPTDRALTTAELARLMAGPQLPTNTTLVASVTIDARTDVCPMNRYPTVGVIEGMGSQVCVMGATLAAELAGPTVTGTFAFRYLAPGYLGLLGGITPASSSKIAFRVAEDWPLAGKTFLVEGYLGAVGLPLSIPSDCATPPTAGDVLDPNGEDCPYDDWLGDDPTAAAIQSDHVYVAGSPEPSYDPLSLRGNARHVQAGGARLIDSIPYEATHGVYVVRSVTGPCPGAAPQDSRGCSAWRVLAKVADVALPEPSSRTAPPNPTPTPTTAPPATPVAEPSGPLAPAPLGLLGSGNRPLTEGEFATLWAADPAHLAGRIAIVKGPVPTGFECWDAGAADAAVPSPACHIIAILDGQIAAEGYWAVRVGADGKLTIVGEISVPQDSYVFTLDQAVAAWNKAGGQAQFFVVDAWINGMGADSCDVVGQACYEVSWLGSTPGNQLLNGQLGAYHEFGAGPVGGGLAIHALFLIEIPNGKTCGLGPQQSAGACADHGEILAHLEAVPAP